MILLKSRSLEKSGLLTDRAIKTVKHKIIKTRRWICWCYDDTYGFFIDTTCGFFIDKCYKLKNTRRWISAIITIICNDESFGKRSQKSRKRIQYG